MFVYYRVTVDDLQLDMALFSKVEMPEYSIYPVSRAPMYRTSVNLESLYSSLRNLHTVTEQVAECCPFE